MSQQSDFSSATSPHSHELFHLIVENIKEYAIFMTDTEGRVVSWNQGVKRLLGYAEDEIIGQSASIIFTPEDLAKGDFSKELELAALTGCAEDKRWHRRKDGSRFWANGMLTALRNEDGTLRGFAKVMRDDTEQKQYEESLLESEQRYHTLFSSIDQGFCIIEMLFDADGKAIDYRFTEVNPAFEKMTGIPVEEATSELTARQLIPNLEDSWVEIYGKVAQTGEAIRFEENSPAMNRWFDVYGFRIGGADSRRVALIFNNISERKQAEEKLRQSEERFRSVVDQSVGGISQIDLDGRFVMVNDYFCEMLQYSREELVKMRLQDITHSEDLARSTELFQRLANEAIPFEIEKRFVRRDESVIWVHSSVSIVRDAQGNPQNAVAVTIDVTKRKQAEEDLHKSLKQLEIERARLAYLFNRAPAFVATLSGPEHIFELTNPSYLQLIGHRDIIGKPVRKALPEVEEQGFFEILDNVFRTGEPFIGKELPIVLQREPNGDLDQRFVDFVYQPIFGADSAVSGIFAHGIDITEQVAARQEAEAANRMKDEFLATLSHELRTPLNAILGWSRIIEDVKLDEEVRVKAVETIVRNARLQSQLIDDILDVSRIISGKMRLEVRPIELASIIESAIESVLPSAQAKEIRLQRVLDSGNSLISGDSNRLQQVVWNLLTNAIKFTPKGGRVQIRLERVNSHIEIIVADSGTGISPEVLPYIFDRFRQADSATTRKQGGLGLGLAIVRHLVEMHGGTVEAESNGHDEGATFTVKLPLITLRSVETAPEKSLDREHPSVESNISFDYVPELAGLHVLVVEDEEDGRLLVTAVLEKCGAKVTAVSSAADGLTTLKEMHPDVLISDIGMPGEDGYSLINQVRALSAEEGGQTPAAALTAYARTEDRLKILRAGFQIHLPKPVEPSELVAVVANLIGRRQIG